MKNAPLKKQPPPTDSDSSSEITFSKDHILDYVDKDETIKAIRLEDVADWYLWQIKEKLDNSIDNIWKHYTTAGSSTKWVYTKVSIDTKQSNTLLFICTVANPNPLNKPVFKDLSSNLNYSMTVGTKQNEYVITRGFLGDAIKRIHAIGYILAKETGLTQWPYPMVFGFNHQLYASVLKVDRMTPKIDATPILRKSDAESSDTEIKNTWPFLSSVSHNITKNKIVDFIKCYSLFTTDISFRVELDDDREAPSYYYQQQQPTYLLNIPATTDKPISNKWINTPSIFYYSLEQFAKRIFATHHKKTTTVYQFVKQFREWNQVPKSDCPDLADVSIYEFLGHDDPSNQDKVIRDLFYRLRREGKITAPPDRVSLPYTVKQERKQSLINRLIDIYPLDKEGLDQKRAVYEVITDGIHREIDHATGETVQFPYAIEIVAIPFSEFYLIEYGNITQESSIVVTAINYSVSPLGINIDYQNPDPDFTGFGHHANKMLYSILGHYGFTFESENNTQCTKIPCIFAINLITPKPTYLSEGKSDIDMTPYHSGLNSVIAAVAKRVRTFKSAKIKTPDLEEQREEREQEKKERQEERKYNERVKERRKRERAEKRAEERRQKEEAKREREANKTKYKNLYQVTEEVLKKRI